MQHTHEVLTFGKRRSGIGLSLHIRRRFIFILQLALEQHDFELRESTYTWIFFSKYTVSVTRCEAADFMGGVEKEKCCTRIVACMGIEPASWCYLHYSLIN